MGDESYKLRGTISRSGHGKWVCGRRCCSHLTICFSQVRKQWNSKKYCQRQNPMMNAERFYLASVLADPDIPLTVFTKNIDTILSKKIKKTTSSASESVLSPALSITGLTPKTSKSSIAWQVPLQLSSISKRSDNANTNKIADAKKASSTTLVSHRELVQQQRIVALEAQLASMSAGKSRTSGINPSPLGTLPTVLQLPMLNWMVLNWLCSIFKPCSPICQHLLRPRLLLHHRHQIHGQLCQESNFSLTLIKAPNLSCSLAELCLLLLLVKTHLNTGNLHPLPLLLHLPTSFLHATNTWT